MKARWILLVIAICLLAAASVQGAAKLKIGDPAPAIDVGRWVKGDPVAKFEPGKVYVVEFWATWCGPCRQSIPHLTSLAKKYKDKVTFAGVSVWERGDVPAFVKSMGDQMDYSVATDTRDGKMAKGWMEAAGQTGIPTAFVVDRSGKIAWIGHPLALEKVLDQVVAGTFNVGAFAAEWAKLQAEQELEAKTMDEIGGLVESGMPKTAVARLEQFTAGDPARTAKYFETRIRLLLIANEPDGYGEIRRQAAGPAKDSPARLAEMARVIVDEDMKLRKVDYDLAASLADRSVELTKQQNPSMLYTQASVYEKKGDVAKAIESATKALTLLRNDKDAPEQAASLLTTYLDGLKAKQK